MDKKRKLTDYLDFIASELCTEPEQEERPIEEELAECEEAIGLWEMMLSDDVKRGDRFSMRCTKAHLQQEKERYRELKKIFTATNEKKEELTA